MSRDSSSSSSSKSINTNSSVNSSSKQQSNVEKTLCIIKPHAYQHREAILNFLTSHSFNLLQRRDVTLTKAQTIRLYVHHYGLPFYQGLIDEMCSGPVCILLLSRPNSDAIAELRSLTGPTDPRIAAQVDPNCLRAKYGVSPLLNGIHSSKNPAEVEREEDCLFHSKKRTMILFGPPASGKGTQCDLLVQAYGLVHISTGDLLRAHVKNGTDLGREIKSYLDSGKLVPDALVTELTLTRLSEHDCEEKGWILDGYPRTHSQAQSLIDAGLVVNRFVVLSADYEELVKRVSGRRFDPKTGTTYHIVYNPPPPGIVADRCVIRSDDRPEIMRARLATYDATISGVIKQFHSPAIIRCESRAGIYDVFALLVRCVEQEGTKKNVAIRSKSANQKKRLTARL